jgi:hypothetical protein
MHNIRGQNSLCTFGGKSKRKIDFNFNERKRLYYPFYAFYAFYAWWIHFPQSGALAEGTSLPTSRKRDQA